MGKTRRSSRDLDDLRSLKEKNRRLSQENRSLRREVQSLRKQIDKIDIDRHHDVQDLVQMYGDVKEEKERSQALRAKWSCHQCGRGTLLLTILNIPGQQRYYRHCNLCSHRTKVQVYTKEVEGVTAAELKEL